jgi:uncharacterized protein YndB with AHSA1/START domain
MGRLLLTLLAIAGIAYFMPAPTIRQEASIEINAPRARVWEALSELRGYSRWHEDVDSTVFLGSRREGVGTEARLDGRFLHPIVRVERWEPSNAVEFSVQFDPAYTRDHVLRYKMEPRIDRTVVTMTEEYRMNAGYLGHLFGITVFNGMREPSRGPALGYLKRLVETGQGVGI